MNEGRISLSSNDPIALVIEIDLVCQYPDLRQAYRELLARHPSDHNETVMYQAIMQEATVRRAASLLVQMFPFTRYGPN